VHETFHHSHDRVRCFAIVNRTRLCPDPDTAGRSDMHSRQQTSEEPPASIGGGPAFSQKTDEVAPTLIGPSSKAYTN
jgi:hypothetical protein